MSDRPEGEAPPLKGVARSTNEPSAPGPALARSGAGTSVKFPGADAEALARIGDRTGPGSAPRASGPRSVGTRSVQESKEEDPDPASAPDSENSAALEDGTDETEPAAAPGAATEGAGGLVSTGISGLDAQYGGGLPNGSLFLLTSEPTTATSVFAAQYAAAGLSEGEVVYYFSMEHAPGTVRQAIGSFLKDEKDLERLRVIDGYPMQFANVPEDARERLRLGRGENPLAALEALLVDPRLKAPARIIIESVSELLANYDEERVFRALRVLRAICRALPATAVASLVSPLHADLTVTRAKHIADGVVEFHVERKGFGIYPYIAITKMRGVTGSARLLLFKETDTGLWLESTKRVF